MASSGVAWRARRVVLVALVGALLGVLGVSGFLSGREVPGGSGASVTAARVDGMVPSRVVGRPVAEPALVCVAELPAGAVAGGIPVVALVRLGEVGAGGITTRYVAHRGVAGVRAPPDGQVDF